MANWEEVNRCVILGRIGHLKQVRFESGFQKCNKVQFSEVRGKESFRAGSEGPTPHCAEAGRGDSVVDGGRGSEGVTMWRRSDRYGGRRLWMALERDRRSLNCILCLTKIQWCRDVRGVLVRIRAVLDHLKVMKGLLGEAEEERDLREPIR